MFVQEGIGNVELIHWPIPISSNGEYRVNCAGLDHQGKGLTRINTGTLTETANNPSGLVLLEVPIRSEFVLEHPLPNHDISVGRTRNKLPGSGGQEGRELDLHR
jgi:hypothetical protein